MLLLGLTSRVQAAMLAGAPPLNPQTLWRQQLGGAGAAHLGGTMSAMKPNAMYPMGSDAAPTSSRFMVFCARQQPMSRVTWSRKGVKGCSTRFCAHTTGKPELPLARYGLVRTQCCAKELLRDQGCNLRHGKSSMVAPQRWLR